MAEHPATASFTDVVQQAKTLMAAVDNTTQNILYFESLVATTAGAPDAALAGSDVRLRAVIDGRQYEFDPTMVVGDSMANLVEPIRAASDAHVTALVERLHKTTALLLHLCSAEAVADQPHDGADEDIELDHVIAQHQQDLLGGPASL